MYSKKEAAKLLYSLDYFKECVSCRKKKPTVMFTYKQNGTWWVHTLCRNCFKEFKQNHKIMVY